MQESESTESRRIKRRHYDGTMGVVVKVISIILPLFSFFYVLNIAGFYFGILFYPESFRAVFLALSLTLIFLLCPATSKAPRYRLPWYDLLFVLVSWIPTVYIPFVVPAIVDGARMGATPTEQALFLILLLLLFEAVRRLVGVVVLAMVVFFLLYAKFAYLLPGLWGAPRFSWERLTEYIYLFDSGIFGFVLGISATVIIVFVTFGQFLVRAGTAKVLMDSALSLAGGYRGGPAKVAIFASAGMGTMSGSATANVGTTGAVTIPLMKSLGYKPHFAAAVETIASTGGVITPPVMGSIAFIMAEVTGLGYGAIVVASILPAILYYVCLYFQVDFESAKLGLAGLPREQLPSAKQALREGGHLLLPIGLLVLLLMILHRDPLESVLYSITATVLVSWLRKGTRMNIEKILGALADSTQGVLMIVPMTAVAGIIMGSVALTGLGVNLAALIKEAAGGSLWLLAMLTWITLYVSGMAVGEIILYIVMAIIVVPAFIAMGVPELAAHMFIFWMAVSMFITPPNCPAVFVACSIAGSGMWRTGFTAMKLGIVAFLLPFVFLIDPALLLIGSVKQIIQAALTSVIGALFLAAAIQGYLLRRAVLWERLLFAIGGLGLFIPGSGTDFLGVLALIPLGAHVAYWRVARRRLVAAQISPTDSVR